MELGLGFGSFMLNVLALGLLTPLSAPSAYALASLGALVVGGVSYMLTRVLKLKGKRP